MLFIQIDVNVSWPCPTVLVLDRNQLSELPDAISQLPKLQTLSVAHNNLRELPGSIGALASLTKLVVAGNQLSAIPPELGTCAKLEAGPHSCPL